MLNNSILKSIIELENLHWAWERAKDFYNDDNYWCDELEIIDFQVNYKNYLKKIQQEILENKYKLSPLKPIFFPKTKGENGELKNRQMFWVSIKDQVVWLAVMNVIGKYYDKQMPFWSYGNRLYVNIYPNKTESTEEKIQWLYGPYRNTTKKTYRSFGQSWPRFRKDIYITSKMMILDKKKYEEQFTDEEKYDIKNNESLRELHKIKYKETSTKYAILFVGNTTKGGIIMLKFQDNNTTVIATFEDFILTAYVIIDELYHQFAPPEVTRRRHILNAKLSDSEIITISLCGELAGVDSENAWFSFVKRNYRHLFPQLCSRSRFNRTRRALMQTTELLRQKMISVFPIPVSSYYIVDSFPLAVCKFGRARYCKAFRGHGADYGKCPSKKETYYGYKVHALITLEGYIASFEITPASTDDREGLRDLADHWSNVTILADKGYVGKNMKQEMQEKNICLFALKRSNSKENWPKSVRQLIFKLRRRVETVFSQLSGQLNAERVLAKSFQGLCTRLVNKVLAYNLCIALNSIFGETCELGKIKKLIF